MKELVILSGKGGTGKTSLTGAFAALAQNAVFADCDVDAADLHLLLDPQVERCENFFSGYLAVIDEAGCTGCGRCAALCRHDAIAAVDGKYRVRAAGCEGCGVCVRFCPAGVIAFPERRCGEWYVSHTRFGPLVHARLGAAAENSGKLVSLVRREARALAEREGRELVLTDGPPGIGCPVIASVTGADALLAVTEPGVAAIHDLERTVALAKHFGVPVHVAVNRADINPEQTAALVRYAAAETAGFAGQIPWAREFTAAQNEGKSVLEVCTGAIREAITTIWENVWRNMGMK